MLKSQLDWGIDFCWLVFRVAKTPIDESTGKQLRDVNVARQ